ncbi:MAG: polysaccharide biosynthesis/export family protein [Dysgonamonadaceae bacterium]|jgi:polysaccharide export outer membrane protein|nr:polysaccharide biosynthesis/export family protein [Dysgonamonadaceae bacterium]
MNFKSIITITLVAVLLSSCTSYRKIGYLQGVETLSHEQLEAANRLYVSKIMQGDLLTINVNATTPGAALPFNLPLTPTSTNGVGGISNTVGVQTYQVDSDGCINFPVLGRIHIAGYTRSELEGLLKNKIFPQYITEEPIVTVRYVNFNVSVLGEVARPGRYGSPSEMVSLFDVLAMAGDLTIFGRRDNVLLKRTNADGSNEFVRLNLQDKNLVLSPYFYMQQNDVVYVEPNKARGNSSGIGTATTLSITVVGVFLSVASILVSVLK